MPVSALQTARSKAVTRLANENTIAASDFLCSAWRQGRLVAELPADLRPATRAEGYAIQAQTRMNWGSPLFGWKIAATSVNGQRHIGVDGPLAGPIFTDRVLPDGGTVPAGPNSMAVAEVEFAFRMGQDIAPRAEAFTSDEVLASVATLHPAIEVPDSRYDDFVTVGAPHLIADLACAHYFVLGPAVVADWRALDLSAHTVLGGVHGKIEREGIGSNVLGDPVIALTWLVNELSGLGIALRKGEVVTTGTCLLPMPIAPGDRVSGDFGALGAISVRIG